MKIIPATREMIEQASGAPLRTNARGLAVVDGEHLLGVAGIALEPDRTVVFANAIEPMREHKRVVIKAYREIMAWCRARRLPVVAQADPGIEGSTVLLDHLGFTKQAGVYLLTHG